MFSSLKALLQYESILNYELEISNDNNIRSIIPFYANTLINIPEIISPEKIIFLTNEASNNELISGKSTDDSCTIIDTNIEKIDFRKNGFYIFLIDSNRTKSDVLIQFNSFFYDKSAVSIILDKTHIKLLLQSIDLQDIQTYLTFKTSRYTGYLLKFLQLVFLVILTIFTTLICSNIVKSMSEKDPIYDDFVVSSANIKKFKDLENKSLNSCLICFEEYLAEDDVRMLECNHYFHPDCVDRWLIGHSNCCPYCRKDIVIKERV